MPDDGNVAASNGSATRAVSNFEKCWLEAKGRPPSPEETKAILTFNRLAKDAELDPLTMLLIVGGSMGIKEREVLFEHLERIEARLDRSATKDDVDALRRNGQVTATVTWWPPTQGELLAATVGVALSGALFCVLLTARWTPAPIAIIGTVVATLLLAFSFVWWRNRAF
jgi:hypothetical protein